MNSMTSAQPLAASAIALPAACLGLGREIAVSFGAPEHIARRDGLIWTKRLATLRHAEPSVRDFALALELWTVAPDTAHAVADLLLLPGRNGEPEQIVGLTPPDFADRATARVFAEAGYRTHVLDYLPIWLGARQAPEVPRAVRRASMSATMAARHVTFGGVAMAVACAALDPQSGIASRCAAICGHSVGTYLAAAAAAHAGFAGRLVLASGVVPYDTLFGSDGKACELHDIAPYPQQNQGFAAILRGMPVTSVQVQYGLNDTVFGRRALETGASDLRAALAAPVEIEAITMGHALRASAALRFLDAGKRGSSYVA